MNKQDDGVSDRLEEKKSNNKGETMETTTESKEEIKNEIVVKENRGHLASVDSKVFLPAFNEERVQLLKKQIMPPDSTDNELKMFLMVTNRTQLDPFARQIYAIRRTGKMNFEVSIDGARLVAERTGHYRGQIGPYWCGEDGKWVDVWVKSTPPTAAKIGVIRDGFNEPLVATALYREYRPAGKQAFMWDKLPALMIAKVAEMLALRRAFPHELSGIYSQEEMQQAQGEASKREAISTVSIIRDAIVDEIVAILRKLTNNFADSDRLDSLREMHNIPTSKELASAEEWKKKDILERLREELEEEPLSLTF
ncbi:MAG: phage recombination protein Bet [Oligoflexia bacterium]|nr:phage recombination protein Bet [Oligoflexia bacterium]